MSVGEDPLWVVPYTNIAADFQDLLQDQDAYIDVRNHMWSLLGAHVESGLQGICLYTNLNVDSRLLQCTIAHMLHVLASLLPCKSASDI